MLYDFINFNPNINNRIDSIKRSLNTNLLKKTYHLI